MLHFVFVGSHPPILSNSQCLKGFSLIVGLIHFYTFRFTPYNYQRIKEDLNTKRFVNITIRYRDCFYSDRHLI